MRKSTAAFMVVATSFAAGAIAIAGNRDSMWTVSASDARHAALTAIEAAGPGWATLNRAASRQAAWEVRVTRADGSFADVWLDQRFKVLEIRHGQPSRPEPAPPSRSGSDEVEETITAADADRAARAARGAVRGGTVDDIDRDTDGGAAWEVEILRRDGSSVDVLLDDRFRLIRMEKHRERAERTDERDERRDDD